MDAKNPPARRYGLLGAVIGAAVGLGLLAVEAQPTAEHPVIPWALHVVAIVSFPTVAVTYPLTIAVGEVLPAPLAAWWWDAAYVLWPAVNGAMLGYLIPPPAGWWTAGARPRAP